MTTYETETTPRTQQVITYQHAYVGGTSTLCRRHAEHRPESVPALGPVEHGAHAGYCDVCDPISDD